MNYRNMMNGLRVLEWNEIIMEESIKKEEKESKEDKSIDDLEKELKSLQRKIDASSGIVKNKLEKKVEKPIQKEKPTIKIEQMPPKVIDEEIEKKTVKEKELEKLWKLYEWASNTEKFPWMYWIPDKDSGIKNWKENFESWKNDWSKFTIDWARVFILHILDMYEIAKEKPYISLNDRERAIDIIFKELVEMKRGKTKIAKWTDKDKNKIRLYWRSLDEWANIFYNWAFEGGGDIFTLIDLRNLEEEIPGFGTLPEDDLREIIDILVKQKKARWIDKKLIRVKILFKGL
ncbi:MAG: hypothetical protein EU551_01145 [Promethearchaeota archaeon]|nr:MAG: hypothetical protein EU551_01145 [Candidatus Lokiarchaeota archaeon]